MGAWPPWRLTAAQRKGCDCEGVTADDLLAHYAERYVAKVTFKGTPEDMPPGFIMKSLFWTGAVAPIKVFGEDHITPASPILRGMYGQPLTWLPQPVPDTVLPPDVMREHKAKEEPVLWFDFPLADELRPLCESMERAFRCLDQTVQAMQQPVILQGVVGGEINAVQMGKSLESMKIYTLDRAASSATTLDLGGHDYTQNLISTINALDCECLARMGIKSPGTEKASGVTVEETVSVTQELDLINRYEISRIKAWVEKVRDRFPGLEAELSPEVALNEYTDKASMPGREEPGGTDRGDGTSPQQDKDDGGEA